MTDTTRPTASATPTPRPGTPSRLRAINDRAALDLLLEHGPLSRTRIGTLTGLSKPTASQLLARLSAAGLVVPVGTTAGGPGPNAQLYQVNPAAGYVAGLDVKPTHTLFAVADITGRTLAEHLLATPPRQAAGTVQRLADGLAETVRLAGLEAGSIGEIVIGTPGALDPATGKLRYAAHLPGWHSPRLPAELQAALGAPVSIENDVNLAAVAERVLGCAQGYDDFVLLWAEEGIGAAIMIAGQLHRGFTGGAGEVGYMPVPGAPLIRNVRRENSGGFQKLAGADAVLALAKEHRLAGGTAEEAIATALATPGAGDEFLAVLANRLATGLAAIVAVIDPELVVLSGGIPTAGGERLRDLVHEELTGLAVPRPELRSSTVPGSPVLHGALQRALTAARETAFTTA
ncbi:putative NBD/HSP70 family sugar kinase [Kitasatospora sp. MAP12-15]|uniref:ROK family transcriptional regulator n=1 Tax=unclassified Kitasatospora TaxID=2633591 RepID=UPI0024748B11|nr:ROK family transcriptional regulator [Kitasatospora sp. MAP12-44]MDH6113265.1 putative NBD/HSP70 family sugar kinase [Kitasatospora sp. MAP12-44]